VKKHYLYTDSDVAKRLMDDWDLALTQFVKVMPTDYKRVLAERAVTAA
jgi:glutamate synthase (NADPH/NADH) large chain